MRFSRVYSVSIGLAILLTSFVCLVWNARHHRSPVVLRLSALDSGLPTIPDLRLEVINQSPTNVTLLDYVARFPGKLFVTAKSRKIVLVHKDIYEAYLTVAMLYDRRDLAPGQRAVYDLRLSADFLEPGVPVTSQLWRQDLGNVSTFSARWESDFHGNLLVSNKLRITRKG